MSRGLSQRLANASVSLKLAVGFGLVMLMTLMISATSWFSNQALIDRGDRVTAIAEINELTLSSCASTVPVTKTCSTQKARQKSELPWINLMQHLRTREACCAHLKTSSHLMVRSRPLENTASPSRT